MHINIDSDCGNIQRVLGEIVMCNNQTQSIKMPPYEMQTVSFEELVSGSELIEFLRVEIPYG